MNKKLKILFAVLGGINSIFTAFIPTLIAILILDMVVLSELNQVILIVTGLLSTLYRALSNLMLVLKS